MRHLVMSNSIVQYMQLGMIERKTGILMDPQIYHYLSLMGYFPGENFGPYRKKYEKKKERNMNNRGILSIAPTWVVSMFLALDSMLEGTQRVRGRLS